MSIIAVAIFLITGVVYFLGERDPSFRVTDRRDPVNTEEHSNHWVIYSGGVVPIPKPSIAVLPVTNFRGNADQEYLSDGITNDIITDLSKLRELFVIAASTMFTYKGKNITVQELGHELGVRYVLEGSLQKRSDTVRITAQLVDAATQHYLWGQRYEREMQDLFALQDEIVKAIVTTLAINVDLSERRRAMRKDTGSLEAYDYVLRGREYLSRDSRSANFAAREMLKKAIELDPGYARAYVELGLVYRQAFLYGWTEFPNQTLTQAQELAQKALSLDKFNSAAHRLLGSVYRKRMQLELAINELEHAIELNPNDAEILCRTGCSHALYWADGGCNQCHGSCAAF